MINANTIYSHDKVSANINRLLDAINAIDTKFQWEQRAKDMTLKTGKPYKAVDRGGYYQIWLVQSPSITP